MKPYRPQNKIILSFAVGFVLTDNVNAEKDRPAGSAGEKSGDQAIAELLSQPAYIPLPGQIAAGAGVLSEIDASLKAISNAVETGPQGQASPWFARLQSLRTKLAQLAASKLQTDLFAQIPETAEFFAADGNAPEFANHAAAALHALDLVTIHAIKQHIVEQNAAISPNNLAIFIKVFSNKGFVNEPDWEDSPIPIDSAGIMILDVTAVVAQLKSRPWQEAEQFLGNATAAQAFARYAASGDGIAVLKTKYATNQAAVTQKWDELAAWVVTQRPPN